MKKKSKVQKQDHFLKLPDEIVIAIFTKLSQTHFKFLCQSVSLVSKRFAFLILRIPTISISISISLHPPFIDPLVILEKFVEIRSLRIQFLVGDENSSNSEPMVLKWKVNSNPKSETFVFLSATSVLSKNEHKGEGDNEIQMPTRYMINCLGRLAFGCRIVSYSWLSLMKLLIQCHPLLRSVTITDSNKHGMLCIKDENLCELKNTLIKKTNHPKLQWDDINQLPNMVKTGFLPVLHLPLSGLVMKSVVLVMYRAGANNNGDNDDDDDDEMLNWDFDDEEKLFAEALTTIFRNHKDKLSQFQSTM